MKFVNKAKMGSFDFTKYKLEEIRGALKIVCDYSPSGAQVFNKEAMELANLMRAENLAPAALLYMQTAGHLTTRVISPFNLQNLLVEKFGDYRCDEQKMIVQGKTFKLTVGFVNYKDQDDDVKQLLPGTKVVPFDAAFCLNVSTAAGMSRYLADKTGGKVIPVTPPTNLYPGAPYDASSLCSIFEPNIGGIASLTGLEWAHFMYQYFYDTRLKFMESFAATVILPDVVLSKDKAFWAKTYKPETWTAYKPKDDVQRLESLAKMQAYRSKDNTGISALTYGIYGEEFGAQYRLVEKMGSFEIFLESLGEPFKKYPIRYITNDERELVSAHLLMKKYQFSPKHYYIRPLDGVEPTVGGEYVYTDTIIFHPKCCTRPFTGKLNEINVQKYICESANAAGNRIAKYQGAVIVGFKGHVLGLENHVIGMATPHNAVATMVANAKTYRRPEIWTTIMIAGYVRNTYLYHRRTLAYMLNRVDELNAKSKVQVKYMPWKRLTRPDWHPFTKEQRKRVIVQLNEFERFGVFPDDISDQNLLEIISKAQDDPDFQAQIGRNREADRRTDNIFEVQAAVPRSEVHAEAGDDLEELNEPDRPELVIKLSPKPDVSKNSKVSSSLTEDSKLTNPNTEDHYGNHDDGEDLEGGDSQGESDDDDHEDPFKKHGDWVAEHTHVTEPSGPVFMSLETGVSGVKGDSVAIGATFVGTIPKGVT